MTPPPPRYTLLTAARLLDGSGSAAVEQAALLIDGDRVAGLGRAADVHDPGGATVERRDYGAATILPGLVDAHTHLVAPGDGTLGDDIAKEDDDILLLQAAKNARTLLHSGVTTLRENGAKGKVAFSLREGIRRRLAPGPRMIVCGRPIAITGGHMGYFGSEADGEYPRAARRPPCLWRRSRAASSPPSAAACARSWPPAAAGCRRLPSRCRRPACRRPARPDACARRRVPAGSWPRRSPAAPRWRRRGHGRRRRGRGRPRGHRRSAAPPARRPRFRCRRGGAPP